jgi:hypothetical protein
MATTKKRINVTLPALLDEALMRIARRDSVPQATKAAELLTSALELEEDVIWDALATARAREKVKLVPHKKVWG